MQCEHEACDCVVDSGYCSDYCQKNESIIDDDCDCGHPECH